MPAKKVLQYECDRCPNVWYVPESAKEQPAVDIKLDINIPNLMATKVNYTCLCEGCLKTVMNLLGSVDKVSKKVSPNRKAKKKEPVVETAAKDSSSTAAPAATPVTVVTSMKPVLPNVVSVPAAGANGGAVGKQLPLASSRPTR
jgi:hypothetical protein